ncbi:hypothetical protein KOI35_21135 [Actinoplanes bogorensis]|uniref:4Fe-4S ferredoxin-type domain-containing protein n=1 Tax=Paractinoplanes bogorensis TaxID=1610840 RepID=A0ABS5YSH3_9ACTN|nr:hypothetical protein [Actinoplanes bogorensis]MBU2666021.1 hypothetical protein [Actinoplanes bogorensis]
MILGLIVATALLLGFLAGFVCFKKTNEYCGRCGVTRVCPVCPAPEKTMQMYASAQATTATKWNPRPRRPLCNTGP